MSLTPSKSTRNKRGKRNNRTRQPYKNNRNLCPHTSTNSLKKTYIREFSCKNINPKNVNQIHQRLHRAGRCKQIRKNMRNLRPPNRRNDGHNFVITFLSKLQDECKRMLNLPKKKLIFF